MREALSIALALAGAWFAWRALGQFAGTTVAGPRVMRLRKRQAWRAVLLFWLLTGLAVQLVLPWSVSSALLVGAAIGGRVLLHVNDKLDRALERRPT